MAEWYTACEPAEAVEYDRPRISSNAPPRRHDHPLGGQHRFRAGKGQNPCDLELERVESPAAAIRALQATQGWHQVARRKQAQLKSLLGEKHNPISQRARLAFVELRKGTDPLGRVWEEQPGQVQATALRDLLQQ